VRSNTSVAIVPELAANFSGADISADGSQLVVSTHTAPTDLYLATWDAQNSIWHTPVAISELNLANDQGYGSFSRNGLSLFYETTLGTSGGTIDIYVAERASMTSPFSAPISFAEINTNFDESDPCISKDGLTFMFARDVLDGNQADLYMMTRSCL